MNDQPFFIAAAVCILTHIIRSVYEILKHKNKVKADKLTFAIIFSNMMLLWISWFALCSFDKHTIQLPGYVSFAGLAIAIAGLVLFLSGLLTIKSLESYEGDLMTRGIYSVIRHPMYLGFICWLVGFPVFYGGIYSFFMAVPFIANVLFWRSLEEKELVTRFPGYPAYKKTTYF
jgi:protein-S-isoprenylcysteine O-methyltransferase Ste14